MQWNLTWAEAPQPDGKPSPELKRALKMADCVYRCEHQTAAFTLRADEAGMYRLPHPVCVDCRAELSLVQHFGETTSAGVGWGELPVPQSDGDGDSAGDQEPEPGVTRAR